MKVLFWLSAIGAIYSYALYPLILKFLVSARKHESVAGAYSPKVTLIIACRNEERRLAAKIENAMKLAYQPLEIMVASDASDDRSDTIVDEYANRGVRLVRSPERRGKEHAQGLAIGAATGDLLVFSDAGTDLPPDSIGFIVDRFRDPSVGAVSSEDLFIGADGKLAGEGAYVKYEMWLRRLESERGGLVGLSGSFFAVRRAVIKNWIATIPSDFACALMTRRAGLVAVSDSRVRGIYKDIKDPKKEYQRKVRTAIRGMAGLATMRSVMNPFTHGLFAFQVFSHKLMRWLVPWFLAGLIVASLYLYDFAPLYRVATWVQVVGYALVLLAHFVNAAKKNALVRIAYYFVQANVALAHAGVLFIRGKRVVVWDPSVR
jgi:glycosyltransferase involved in cell wall biosynthesis